MQLSNKGQLFQVSINAEENNTGMLGAMDGMFPNEESILSVRKGDWLIS